MQSGIPANGQADPRMQVELHDILTVIETLHEHGQFTGCVARFFKIIEMCANKRSESSVSMLIEYHAQLIHPGKENWLSNLYQLLDKYFRWVVFYWHASSSQTKAVPKRVVISFNKKYLSDNLHMHLPRLDHELHEYMNIYAPQIEWSLLVCL